MFAKLYWALTYSIAGLKAALSERAFRQEVFLLAIAVVVVVCSNKDSLEQLLLLGSVVMILIVELLNTAVEAAIDRISLEEHELSKKAKDMGSAAVFLAIVFAILVWLVIFL